MSCKKTQIKNTIWLDALDTCIPNTTLKFKLKWKKWRSKYSLEKKYICGTCYKLFSKSEYLRQHIRKNKSYKGTIIKYICVKCSNLFVVYF